MNSTVLYMKKIIKEDMHELHYDTTSLSRKPHIHFKNSTKLW